MGGTGPAAGDGASGGPGANGASASSGTISASGGSSTSGPSGGGGTGSSVSSTNGVGVTDGGSGAGGGAGSASGSGGLGSGGSAPAPLTAAWSHQTTSTLQFDGLADAAGNLYWQETDGEVNGTGPTWELVSFAPTGQERFRVKVGLVLGSPIVLGDRLVLVERVLRPNACEQTLVVALSTQNGSTLWSHDVIPDITPSTEFPNACPQPLTGTPSAGPRAGTVIVSAKDFKPYDPVAFHDAALLVLDAATGQVLATAPREGDGAVAPVLTLDEDGQVYAASLTVGTSAIYSLAPDLTLRWSTAPDEVEWVVAASGGLVIETAQDASTSADYLRIRSGADGRVISAATHTGQPVIGPEGLTYRTVRDTAPSHLALVRVDVTTGADVWVHLLDPASEAPPSDGRQNALVTTEVVRTASGTYVLATQHVTSNVDFHDPQEVDERPVVREIDGAGQEVFSAPLDAPGKVGSAAALIGERLTVSGYDQAAGVFWIRSYPLPGRTAATSGWVSERADMQRDQRAR